MSEPGFEELQRLWQSPSPVLAPAQKIILRQRRRRWLSLIYLGLEIALTIVAVPFSIWVALQPQYLVLGLGLLVFTLLCAGASLWARSVRVAPAEDALLASVDTAIRRARIGVRLAYSTLWALLAAMVLMAIFGVVWWSSSDRPDIPSRRMMLAFAFSFVWVAIWLGAALFYLWARSRELTQMLLVREALRNDRGQ
jgi:hypothetical protein